MLSEIYLGSALAMFLAVFGWSEKIFGLSNKHILFILSFCEKSKISYRKYTDLMKLIAEKKVKNPGRYQKKLVSLLRGSSIQSGDKNILNLLRNNGLCLKKLESQITIKKYYFLFLFLFLFMGGTLLFYLEKLNQFNQANMLIAQVILLFIIIIGILMYNKTSMLENTIESNLNEIITKIEDR
jgi:hypothetical protein